MNIYITKYKAAPNGILNYFSVPSVIYVDHMIIYNEQILTNAFSDYSDQLNELDDPFAFTTGGYNLQLSLLRPSVSATGKTMTEFFDPATDNYRQVGFKVSIGESAAEIERSDFIEYTSIKCNWRQDDKGWILSFSVTAPDEEYIRRAETLQAVDVTTKLNYRTYLSELLVNPLVFSHVNLVNSTSTRYLLAGFNPFQPVISFPIHNAVLSIYNDKTRWRVFLNWAKDQAWAYRVESNNTFTAGGLDSFNFKVFFPSDSLGTIAAPEVVSDNDYLVGNTLEYALDHLAMYYVSYTSPALPSQDWLGSLYMNRNETTIGYTNMDAYGLVEGYQQNNIFKNYKLGDFVLRNSIAINEKDMLRPASERGFVFPASGVSLGASIGRSLVKDFTYSQVQNSWVYFGDTGFPDVVRTGPVREYKRHIAGAKQTLEYTGRFQNQSDMKIYKKFYLRDKWWLIRQITERKFLYDKTGVIKAVEL